MKIGKTLLIVGGVAIGGLVLLSMSVYARGRGMVMELPDTSSEGRKARGLRLARSGSELRPVDMSDPSHRQLVLSHFRRHQDDQAAMKGVVYGHGYAAGKSPYPNQGAVIPMNHYWHRENPFGAPE